MKKALEIISASGLLLGLVFKLFHWPGCDLLLIFSLGLFIPIFYLSELVSGWKSKPSKFLILVNFLALSTLTESILFKLMHWPGSDMMLIISLWFLWPIYFISKGIIQRKAVKGTLLNGMLYSIFPIAILFVLMHWPGVDVVKIFAFGILLIVVASSFLRKESVQLIELNFSGSNTKITSLVIFAFLYLIGSRYISKSVLNNESYAQLELQEKFQLEKELGDRYINEKNKAKANYIDAETVKLIHIIDDVKLDIIRQVGELNPSEIRRFDDDVVLWKVADPEKLELTEINLLAVVNKFNLDVASFELIGSNMKSLSRYGGGYEIWKEFTEFQATLVNQLESTDKTEFSNGKIVALEGMKQNTQYWRTKESVEFLNNNRMHWMARTFVNSTVLQSIVQLTEMQLEIIRMRNLALSGL